jgi:PAS domain S-box-containing protein
MVTDCTGSLQRRSHRGGSHWARDHNKSVEPEFIDVAAIPDLDDRISTPPNENHRNARTDLDDDRVTDLDGDLNVRDGVAHLRDVTDKLRADDANRFLALLLSAVGQSVIASDADGDGVITYWNAAAEAMFGWVADEVIGDRLVSILPIHPRSLSDANELQWNSLQICSGELWLRMRSGSSIPVMQTYTPVYDVDGARVGTIGVSTDISERVRTDEARISERARTEDARALLHSIALSTQDAIFSADVDGFVTTWNDGAAALFGYTASEITGRHISTVLPLAGADGGAAVLRVFEEAERGHVGAAVDARCGTADGRKWMCPFPWRRSVPTPVW